MSMQDSPTAVGPPVDAPSRAARGEQLKRDGIVIRTWDLRKTYVMGGEEIHAVSGVSIEIKKGEYVAIIDRKSTRLNSSHSQQSRMPSSA